MKSPLRRGAWYKILKLGAQEAALDVRGKTVVMPRTTLEIAPAPKPLWTVVPSPRNAPRFPTSWGSRYAVCPNCRERAQLEGKPTNLRCHRCNGLFDIAWPGPDLAAG